MNLVPVTTVPTLVKDTANVRLLRQFAASGMTAARVDAIPPGKSAQSVASSLTQAASRIGVRAVARVREGDVYLMVGSPRKRQSK